MRALARWLVAMALVAAPAFGRPAIYLTPDHPVYAWFERLSAKGLLPHAPLDTRPWTREEVARALIGVRRDDERLTRTDRERWRFYVGEFADEVAALGADSLLRVAKPAWWTDAARPGGGFRGIFSVHGDRDAAVRLVPGFGVGVGRDSSVIYSRYIRLGGWAYFGSHWSAQATVRDDAYVGKDVVPPPRFGPEHGWAAVDGDSGSSFSVDDPEGLVTLSSRFAAISAGVYPVIFGPGARAQVILSDKPPAVPQVRLTARPVPWLTFTYVHLSLQSGIRDSTGPPNARTPAKAGYLRKYYAAHRLELTVVPGLDLAFGESVVYGARSPELVYLVPVVPFRAAQHDIGNLDNLQMWADVALARIPWTRLYGALFIDELSIRAILRGDAMHNWWAWQVGALGTDLWGLAADLDVRVEYTRANPWTYHHLYPWNTYDTWALQDDTPVVAYPLGFWQGHNGDFVRGDLVWRPRRDVELAAWASQARHGGDGTTDEQYNPPTEPFLFGPRVRTREGGVSASWEVRRDLVLRASLARSAQRGTHGASPASATWTAGFLGITYNVW